MLLPFSAEIFLYPKPIDFRKQIDGIVEIVADTIDMNPTSGQIFIFRNKLADKLKILYWDRNGFWLLYRRLEQGSFVIPNKESAMSITLDQFNWLLSGLSLEEYMPIQSQKYNLYY